MDALTADQLIRYKSVLAEINMALNDQFAGAPVQGLKERLDEAIAGLQEARAALDAVGAGEPKARITPEDVDAFSTKLLKNGVKGAGYVSAVLGVLFPGAPLVTAALQGVSQSLGTGAAADTATTVTGGALAVAAYKGMEQLFKKWSWTRKD